MDDFVIAKGGTGSALTKRQITMYNYAFCTSVLYVVCLDNFNFVNIFIIQKSQIESHHSLCIAGTGILQYFFMFVHGHLYDRSMTTESDFLNRDQTSELLGSPGAPDTRNMIMYIFLEYFHPVPSEFFHCHGYCADPPCPRIFISSTSLPSFDSVQLHYLLSRSPHGACVAAALVHLV